MALDIPFGTPDCGEGIFITTILLIVLITVFTLLRVISKFVAHQDWWWDDFFAILALPLELIVLSLVLAWRQIGLGYHMDVVAEINPEYIMTGARYLYVATFFFDGSVCVPKISALFFYARVFRSNNRAFRIHLWIVGGLTSGWLLAAWITTILECHPIPKVWNTTIPGTCIAQFQWYISTAALSSTIDLYILCLPIPMIWGLQVSLKRRVYLLTAFMMAYSVVVLSLGRLVAVVQVIPIMNQDFTWLFVKYCYWSVLEGSISIISISVPNCIALVKALRNTPDSKVSLGSNQGSRKSPSNMGSHLGGRKDTVSWQKGHAGCGSVDKLVSDVQVSPSEYGHRRNMDIPLGAVRIETDIEVSRLV
ncbi:hypothetical protein BO83DRAFT_374232 [Aspergillus eucalypticola CBS 122712]|uniref:Rhodopsin domain-containing protein n=1 Tax=Aspergillus eucalypticola (strain CBS 122712 / IBT 29274) TaxID=1448314 RepID=A0A317WJN4_ASPEC|nr:uncharacterized protein BO83DRAFT_374232 [Aspergillus eucalypticola CBS 122712]PWY85492.1 hypothetical protein BO83DRAFT_374232 [Aspergillus eucalypticola CBS 122712]